jgi:hypothetical protein
MKKRLTLALTAILVFAFLAGPVAAAQAAAQTAAQAKPEDMKKLVAEIVGDYEFSAEGQTLLVQFTNVDGKLFGAPPGETPEELSPVAGKPLCFDITLAQNGEYYVLQFVRNDKGVIDKCSMTVQGMTIDGVRIVK